MLRLKGNLTSEQSWVDETQSRHGSANITIGLPCKKKPIFVELELRETSERVPFSTLFFTKRRLTSDTRAVRALRLSLTLELRIRVKRLKDLSNLTPVSVRKTCYEIHSSRGSERSRENDGR